MGLYSDIIHGEYEYAAPEVRKDGETWTVYSWEAGHELYGFINKAQAEAVAEALKEAYEHGEASRNYS